MNLYKYEDYTQVVLDIYEGSTIWWVDSHKLYRFCNTKYQCFIFLSFNTGEIGIGSLQKNTKVLPSSRVDQNHPEVVKIRKRLQFLNKL